ncbi:MAG: hypothetical protein V4717_17660 [Bacteroidota bacterium]
MNQQQSIGSHNQQQGMPDNRNEKTTPAEKPKPNNQQTEKPAITDDAGNQVDRLSEDAGKGYSERKQTEPYSKQASSDNPTENAAPEDQSRSSEKVYGAGTEHQHENLKEHNHFPQQLSQEEKEAFEKRIRQSGNVPG